MTKENASGKGAEQPFYSRVAMEKKAGPMTSPVSCVQQMGRIITP